VVSAAPGDFENGLGLSWQTGPPTVALFASFGSRIRLQVEISPRLQVHQMFAFMGLGTVELIIVAGVILLLFGSRLPKVMRSLGEGIVEFKRGVQGIEDENAAGRGDGHR